MRGCWRRSEKLDIPTAGNNAFRFLRALPFRPSARVDEPVVVEDRMVDHIARVVDHIALSEGLAIWPTIWWVPSAAGNPRSPGDTGVTWSDASAGPTLKDEVLSRPGLL